MLNFIVGRLIVFLTHPLLLFILHSHLRSKSPSNNSKDVHVHEEMVISDEVQFRHALTVFGRTYQAELGEEDWAIRNLGNLRAAGISSMNDLRQGCKDGTVNLDLELFGVPLEERLSERTLAQLSAFLPGPVGFRCFRLAQKCAEKVKNGTADVKYIHRPAVSSAKNEEQWDIPVNGDWAMHVDCAGFVRNILKYTTKNSFRLSLSDRDFMRAKDFFHFFETVPYSVLDEDEIPENELKMKWRCFRDLRMVIAGDIIVYRPKGNAAGGAAFTTDDRLDIKRMLRAVKTAELWHEEEREWKHFVRRNLAKDAAVKEWADLTQKQLEMIGIQTVQQFRANADSVNDMLVGAGLPPLGESTLNLLKECSTTTALNTGHIVFASGPAVRVLGGPDDSPLVEYRIPVIHSTKFGKLDEEGNPTEGIQEHFRRFTMIEHNGSVTWTRTMKQCPVVDDDPDEDDDPFDDMNPDEDDELAATTDSDSNTGESKEELEGQIPVDVEVLAARMCF
jgi:hypothetical protein